MYIYKYVWKQFLQTDFQRKSYDFYNARPIVLSWSFRN